MAAKQYALLRVTKAVSGWKKIAGLLALALLSPLWVPVLFLQLLYTAALYTAAWLAWCTRGRDVLVVYSESPIWRDRIERELLPKLEGRAVVLNWSERRHWLERLRLSSLVFRHFGGSREFNPLAVVFQPFRLARTFRFWRPYKDFKHGKAESVERMEQELLALLAAKRS